jgi:hypothetical protein
LTSYVVTNNIHIRRDILKESEKKLIKLYRAISKVGGVVCSEVPHIFYPEDSYGTDQGYHAERKLAMKICSQCPVQKLCADYAITAREPYGIWGGTVPSDR